MQVSMRIDHVEGALAAITAYLGETRYGGFGVEENSEGNRHYHFLLEGFNEKKDVQAFRVAMTRKAPMLKGNGGYSISVVKDLDKYARYICKGASSGESPVLVWRQSLKYDDGKIAALHDAYWEENRKLKKRAAVSMVDFVVDEAKRRAINWRERSALSKIYIDEMVARGKPLNMFAGKSTINTVQVLLCPNDDAARDFADLM